MTRPGAEGGVEAHHPDLERALRGGARAIVARATLTRAARGALLATGVALLLLAIPLARGNPAASGVLRAIHALRAPLLAVGILTCTTVVALRAAGRARREWPRTWDRACGAPAVVETAVELLRPHRPLPGPPRRATAPASPWAPALLASLEIAPPHRGLRRTHPWHVQGALTVALLGLAAFGISSLGHAGSWAKAPLDAVTAAGDRHPGAVSARAEEDPGRPGANRPQGAPARTSPATPQAGDAIARGSADVDSAVPESSRLRRELAALRGRVRARAKAADDLRGLERLRPAVQWLTRPDREIDLGAIPHRSLTRAERAALEAAAKSLRGAGERELADALDGIADGRAPDGEAAAARLRLLDQPAELDALLARLTRIEGIDGARARFRSAELAEGGRDIADAHAADRSRPGRRGAGADRHASPAGHAAGEDDAGASPPLRIGPGELIAAGTARERRGLPAAPSIPPDWLEIIARPEVELRWLEVIDAYRRLTAEAAPAPGK